MESTTESPKSSFLHNPVMLEQVLASFKDVQIEGPFLDGTFGRGGHSQALYEYFKERKIYSIDQDPIAIIWGKTHMPWLHLIQDNFFHIDRHFVPESLAGILLDLGVSSPQLDNPARGFSFQKEGPLDMRMSMQGRTALDIIADSTEKELADILYMYGQERASRKIASCLKHALAAGRLNTTKDLASLVCRFYPRLRRHGATRVFQALRIVVNKELEALEKVLPIAQKCLKKGGVLIVLSFHSLEDRIVKFFFKNNPYFLSLKKPLKPEADEITKNPRARSAVFRKGLRM